jgi:hypothetical protein
MSERKMVLGLTDGFRYIGFQPPVSAEDIRNLPVPDDYPADDESFQVYLSHQDDGSLSVGFDSMLFDEPNYVPLERPEQSIFVNYAKQVAGQIGNVSLDTTVRILSEGSMFAQPDNH